jgi:hypothetical protein
MGVAAGNHPSDLAMAASTYLTYVVIGIVWIWILSSKE